MWHPNSFKLHLNICKHTIRELWGNILTLLNTILVLYNFSDRALRIIMHVTQFKKISETFRFSELAKFLDWNYFLMRELY